MKSISDGELLRRLFSEHEAYLRIAAARASRKHPMLLAMLGDGRLHLSGMGKLAPHLTESNGETLLGRAAHRSKREIEELVAEIAPKPDVPPGIRKLPKRSKKTAPPKTAANELGPDRVGSSTTPEPDQPDQAERPAERSVVQPLAPERYRVQFTASASLRDKLERLQALMRSVGTRRRPRGDHRRGRHGEARNVRIQTLCRDQGPAKEPRTDRYIAVVAPHPGRGEARRSCARRRAMHIRRSRG